jgi:hypothetical protein
VETGGVETGGAETGGVYEGVDGADGVGAATFCGSALGGFGFGFTTRLGSASASPSVDWPSTPEATSIGSAGDPGGPEPSLACPGLLSP